MFRSYIINICTKMFNDIQTSGYVHPQTHDMPRFEWRQAHFVNFLNF